MNLGLRNPIYPHKNRSVGWTQEAFSLDFFNTAGVWIGFKNKIINLHFKKSTINPNHIAVSVKMLDFNYKNRIIFT